MGFSRQEYWSGLPVPSPEDHLDPDIKLRAPALQADSLPSELQGKPGFDPWVGKTPWRRDRPPTPVFLGFPGGSAGKESACNGGDLGLIPGLGRCHGEGNGYPLQYSGLESSMDRGAW